jgi:hypothetical protein
MGVLVLSMGVAALGFGAWAHVKGRRVLSAPFRGTGALAVDPTTSDPKGMIATEGEIVPLAEQLFSPITQTPCLHYQVEIRRHFQGNDSAPAESMQAGALFGLDDGTGIILVDASQGAEFDTHQQSFKETVAIGAGLPDELVFGALRLPTPRRQDDAFVTGFEAVEKIIPMEGTLLAVGKLDGGKIVHPGWRSLRLSSKGRAAFVGSADTRKAYGFMAGAAAVAVSIPLFLFAPARTLTAGDTCGDTLASATLTCTDNLTSQHGNSHAFTVSELGHYSFEVAPPAGRQLPLDARVIVARASGDVVADEYAPTAGQPAFASVELEPGQYRVTVKDAGGITVRGGFDYTLKVARAASASSARKLFDALHADEKHQLQKNVAQATQEPQR